MYLPVVTYIQKHTFNFFRIVISIFIFSYSHLHLRFLYEIQKHSRMYNVTKTIKIFWKREITYFTSKYKLKANNFGHGVRLLKV